MHAWQPVAAADAVPSGGRWLDLISPRHARRHPNSAPILGIVPGEGIGVLMLKRLRLIRVREVMGPIDGDNASGPSVSAEDDLRRVVTLFLEHGVETIRCIDGAGRAIGQVSRAAVAARLGSEIVR